MAVMSALTHSPLWMWPAASVGTRKTRVPLPPEDELVAFHEVAALLPVTFAESKSRFAGTEILKQ